MSFESRETSEYGGEPIVMVKFSVGSMVYGYTPNLVSQSHQDLAYNPLPSMEIDNIVQESQIQSSDLKISVPYDTPISALFLTILTTTTPQVDIYTRHLGDTETRRNFSGMVVAADFKDNFCDLTVATELSLLKTLGLRRTFSRRCQNQLYDPDTCRVDKNLFKSSGTVAGISGNVIQVASAGAQANGYYLAGLVRRINTGEWRFIINHVGTGLTLYAPFIGLALTESVEIYAGCDHTIATCDGKFGNSVNCACWPGVPLRNPVLGEVA